MKSLIDIPDTDVSAFGDPDSSTLFNDVDFANIDVAPLSNGFNSRWQSHIPDLVDGLLGFHSNNGNSANFHIGTESQSVLLLPALRTLASSGLKCILSVDSDFPFCCLPEEIFEYLTGIQCICRSFDRRPPMASSNSTVRMVAKYGMNANDWTNLKKAVERLEEIGVDNLILRPRVDDGRFAVNSIPLTQCERIVDYVLHSNGGSATKITLDRDFLKTRLIKEHPCHVCACSGDTCHGHKNRLSKRLWIMGNGDVLPEFPDIGRRFSYGNMYASSLVEVLRKGEGRTDCAFLNVCRVVYANDLRDWSQSIFPFRYFFMKRRGTI